MLLFFWLGGLCAATSGNRTRPRRSRGAVQEKNECTDYAVFSRSGVVMTGVCIQQQWPTINLPNETSSSSTTGQADSRRNSKKPSSLYLRMTSSIAKLFSSRRKKAASEQVGTLMQFYFSFFFGNGQRTL